MIDLSDDKALLQFDRIHAWLASSYWSPGIARAVVERAAKGSHTLGAYEGGAQVGYARFISDGATFGWIADVWVAEGGRGRGLGRRMVRWFLEYPDYRDLRRVALVTGDAHGVYTPLGFHAPLRPERYMERLHPDTAMRLRSLP